MQIVLHLIVLIGGFVFLIKGADLFIISSSSIARKFNVSPLIIGLTLVAFGTSLPELGVSFAAALSARAQGTTADIAMGNVIGSNIANLTLILGFSAVAMPLAIKRTMFKQEFPFLIFVTILIAVLAFFFQADARIVWWEALILLLFFAYYMYLMLRSHRDSNHVEEVKVINMKKALTYLIIGLAGVSFGGYMVTYGAEYISVELLESVFGMERTRAITLVGLSVVALGTSLPELVTSVMASKKGENEIAMGNILGSNVFNILWIVGLAGLVTPLRMNQDVLTDILISIGITFLVVLFAFTKKSISKGEGWILVFIYFTYITYIILRASGAF